MNYDYIIIGAGIAGLYAAYNIKKIYPNKTFIILEANSKKYIGGRVHQEMFENHLVTTGAGVGRKNKDTYLINLLDELKISYSESNKNFNYTFNPLDLKKIIKNLKVKFIELNKPRKTFKEFVLPILGSTIYKKLVLVIIFVKLSHMLKKLE
jgi:flavin-dependent dehydrogenase